MLEGYCLMEDCLRVLKVMSEVKGRLDWNDFARLVGLSSDDTVRCMQGLLRADFLRKVDGGYGITDAGKSVLKAVLPVEAGLEFHFYVGLGQATSFSAGSIVDFYGLVKQVDVCSLEFHLYRGDFENWARIVLGDETLAEDFAALRIARAHGEGVRDGLVRVLDARFGFDRLE